ncbi:hypothetical protein PIB30_025557 [Stylosanthes scabra]|uniref:Uncharacterized protein n=1 Tax=Stylosanthes scabra TaxID=79078 RepID=A0ABU6Q9N1_9FABA|nr:hypothetical protein [Stylosanthes scabra]
MAEKATDETTPYASGFSAPAAALSEKKEKAVVKSITKKVVTDLNRKILECCHFLAKDDGNEESDGSEESVESDLPWIPVAEEVVEGGAERVTE